MPHPKENRKARSLLTGLFIFYFMAGTIFNAVVPLGEAPDEPAHFLYAHYVALNRKLPVMQPRIEDNATAEAFQAPAYYVVAAWLTRPWMQGEVHLLNNPAFAFGKPLPAYLPLPEHAFPWHSTYLAWHLVRFLSLACGAISLWATYSASLLAFERQWPAVAATAYLALNPQFIYMHSVVTNDAAAIAAGTVLVWAALSLLKRPTLSRFLWIACAISLAALSKPSALTLCAGTGIAMLIAWRRLPSSRDRAIALGLVVLIPLVCSGWWFVRNQQRYGDALGLTNAKRALAANYYPTPLSLKQLTALLPAMFRKTFESSWGKFGWVSLPLSRSAFYYILAAHGIALSGLFLYLINRPRWQWKTVVLVITWLALIGGFLHYNRQTNVSGWQGRFLFPGLSVTAIGFVAGWRQWLKQRETLLAASIVAGGSALVIYALGAIVLPMYRPPHFLPADAPVPNPIDVRFDGGLRLVGYQMTPERVRPGSIQRLTLYWKIQRPIQTAYHFAVDSYTPRGDSIIPETDSPLSGRYPLSFWPVNRIVADDYRLLVAKEAEQMAGTLGIQVYAGYKDAQQPVPVVDASGNPLGTRFEVGQVIASTHGILRRTNAPARAKFGADEILLIGDSVSPATIRPGEALTITLHWRATRPPDGNYHVFVHLLDAEGKLIAQHDSPPRAGRYPTSAWATGETVIDPHPISLPATYTGPLQPCVGLYTLDPPERLPIVIAEPATCPARAVPLATIEVSQR